jgi:hypothetical protein
MYKKLLFQLIQEILSFNVGLAFIAHEDIKTIKTKVMEKECFMPDLTKSSKKIILPKCDLVGYCGQMRIKKGGNKKTIRIVRTSPLDSVYAKDRTLRDKPEDGWERLDAKLFVETFDDYRKDSTHGKKVKKVKKVKKGKKVKKSVRR